MQVGTGGREEWRTFDLPRAMAMLRDSSQDVRHKMLLRLHIRWFHASATAMTQTLKAAGVPAKTLAEIPSVVQGCMICRNWKRPGPRNMTSSRLITEFNAEVQVDLLFIHSKMEPARGLITVVHLVDAAIRWAAAGVSKSKEEEDLCSTISQIWIAIHGPMGVLVSDEESGLQGRCASDWAEANSMNLKPKAPRQEAQIVERHNALLRHVIHIVEEQLIKEGIHITFEQVLSICVFMKNALTVVDG